MTEKVIIFDSGSLISLSMNGLLDEIKKLKSIFKGKFIITKDVEHEVVEKPLTIKRFELEALKIKYLLDQKILERPDSLGIKDQDLVKYSNELLDNANSLLTGKKGKVRLIDMGEASCLALSNYLTQKKIQNVIAMDERTTRLLVESPENLKSLLERRMHTSISYVKKDYKLFQGYKIIRSAELMYVAYKKGLIEIKDKNILDALLYALKFKGCAISSEEISEIKRLG